MAEARWCPETYYRCDEGCGNTCAIQAAEYGDPGDIADVFDNPSLITPEDTEEAFKEKFASSLESQADAMDSAIEAFVDYKDVQGNMMACRSWLRRTAKSIREM